MLLLVSFPIDSITATQILEVCRLYERQGKTDSAKRMRSKASQVFRYAIALGLCQFNVADQISGILKVGKTKHRAEPYRVCRRPTFLRECSNDKTKIYP